MSNLSKNKLQKKENDKEKNKKLSWKFYALMAVCIATVTVAGIIIFLLISSNTKNVIDPSVYSIDYVVRADPEIGHLNIDINIDIEKLSTEKTVLLYKGMVNADSIACTDEFGRDVPFFDTDNLIMLGPIEDDSRKLRFTYTTFIDDASVKEDWMGSTQYTNGCVFDDLIAFSGEHTMLMPFLDPNTFDKIDKFVKNISIEFIVPDGLKPIIPYQEPIVGEFFIANDKPDWEFINCISKSAFCFGLFESYDYDGKFAAANANVFVDRKIIDELSLYSLDAMTAFLNYYTSAFGEPIDDVPIVLLRNHPAMDMVITAGVGSGGAAMSFNMRIPDDFQAMSNMVFHAFFDSKIKPRNLRYTMNEWVYKGLAQYYVENSVNALPYNVTAEFSINSATPDDERYLRYLYFSLKEPGFRMIRPLDEGTMYYSQEEFYLRVKVPVIIDSINASIEHWTGQTNGFLKELVKKGETSAPLDIEKFLRTVCGKDDADIVKDYMSGMALVPNYREFDINGMYMNIGDATTEEIILEILDEDEQRYSYFFNQDQIYYPYIPLFLLNREPFMAEVESRGIHYSTDEIEKEVEKFSDVLHRLLLQYAMWANIAGVDDITQPNIIGKLNDPDVLTQWGEFCQKIGAEFRIEE